MIWICPPELGGGKRVVENLKSHLQICVRRYLLGLVFISDTSEFVSVHDVGLPLVCESLFATLPKLTMPLRDPAWQDETTTNSSAEECFRFRNGQLSVAPNQPVLVVWDVFRHADSDFTGAGNLR